MNIYKKIWPSTSLATLLWLCSLQIGVCQDGVESDEAADPIESGFPVEGELVDFARDVQPILQRNCLECHGPDEAKNDFRVDDEETMLAYLEPGDLESSSLWADYLITDDPDMIMPPPKSGQKPGLSGTELAVMRLWIEEGASWGWKSSEESEAEEAPPGVPLGMTARLWEFQGLFHPASVHFPIACLLVSSLMVIFAFISRESFEATAFHCLWIGALGAIASCVMGWAYAEHEGYGAGFTFDLRESSIDRHRWLGIVVAVIATIMIPVASSVRKSGGVNNRIVWFMGSVIMLLAVAVTGYQGGELTYGEDHYGKEFERLFPDGLQFSIGDDQGSSGITGDLDNGDLNSEDLDNASTLETNDAIDPDSDASGTDGG